MALLPEMVPNHELPSAVALMNIVWQLPRMVGPALAGLLIAVIGVAPAFYLCGAGAFGALVLFGALRLQPRTIASRGSFLRNIVDGLRFVRESPVFSILIAMTFFNSVFGLSYVLMEAVFARDVLHVGSAGFGFMEAVGGIGAICGVLAAAYFARRGRKGLQAIIGAVAFGTLLVAFALSPWFGVSLVILFLCGLSNQVYMTTISTTLQMMVPDAMRGRVMGLFGMTYSLIPLGGTIAGGIAEVAGAPVAVGLGGFLVAAMALAVVWKSSVIRNLE
jgi:predicted MFS family arabinose efflux permease